MENCMSIIVDGENLANYGFSVAERPSIPTPTRELKEVKVPNHLGSYVRRLGFEDVDFTVTLQYLDAEHDDETFAFTNVFYTVRGLLLDATRLELTSDPGLYYIVQSVDLGDAENDMTEYGEFDAKFRVRPFARPNDDSLVITGNDGERYILNDGTTDARPVITLDSLGGGAGIIINDEEFNVINIDPTNPEVKAGDTVVLDSDRGVVYVANDDGSVKHIIEWGYSKHNFPVLKTGGNKVKVNGSYSSEAHIERGVLY